MSYQKNEDGSVTISATLREDEWTGFMLAWGMWGASVEKQFPEISWLLLSMMNRFQDGNPNWTMYEIPADRTQPFTPRHIVIVDTPEAPKQ